MELSFGDLLPRVGLPPEHISTLDPGQRTGSSSRTMPRIWWATSARRPVFSHEGGRTHVHFLLAARDTDWRHFYGDRQALGHAAEAASGQFCFADFARTTTRSCWSGAWRKYGDGWIACARFLAGPRTSKSAALLDAVAMEPPLHATRARSFGGLLAVRFGPAGLRDHVVALLTRLKGGRIEKDSDRDSVRRPRLRLCLSCGRHSGNRRRSAGRQVGVEPRLGAGARRGSAWR
ncbi:MAG: hypothetical protein MZV70_04925 [Desulfobacterales bacterium]|nr:hypothetical protein [Desulfobacterales bacterium]